MIPANRESVRAVARWKSKSQESYATLLDAPYVTCKKTQLPGCIALFFTYQAGRGRLGARRAQDSTVRRRHRFTPASTLSQRERKNPMRARTNIHRPRNKPSWTRSGCIFPQLVPSEVAPEVGLPAGKYTSAPFSCRKASSFDQTSHSGCAPKMAFPALANACNGRLTSGKVRVCALLVAPASLKQPAEPFWLRTQMLISGLGQCLLNPLLRGHSWLRSLRLRRRILIRSRRLCRPCESVGLPSNRGNLHSVPSTAIGQDLNAFR